MSLSALNDMPADDPLVEALENQRSKALRLILAAKRKHKRKPELWWDGYRAWLCGFRPKEGGAYYHLDPPMRAGFEQAMRDHPDKDA